MTQTGQSSPQAALPPGLGFACEFVTRSEEAELIAAIEASGIAHVDYDPGNLRAERTYGWFYHYAEDYAEHGVSLTDPLPPAFEAIRARAAAFAGVEPESLIQCLLLRYDPGSCIQPHCDMPVWNNVIGLSLGEALTMEFVNGSEIMPVELPPRSIYHQTGDARHVWQHSIPRVTRPRWGITFRDFSDEGLRMAGLAPAGAN
jgi:alkylated DNA repair protein (DNA oxidative demethylase)